MRSISKPFALGVVALTALACSTGSRTPSSLSDDGTAGDGGTDAGGSRAASATAGSSAVGGATGGIAGNAFAAAGAENAGAATGGTTGCPSPIELGVHFVGRVDGCEPDAVRFAWSGSGFVAAFEGTGLSVTLRGKTNQFTVVIDGLLQPTLVTTNGLSSYVLATDLVPAAHKVEVYRRTEASFDPTSVLGFDVEGGALLPAPVAPPRLIELVGDSISCGYGNEGASSACQFSAATENHYRSYGALLARGFGAELSTVAWSGKGVASNYGGDRFNMLPALYERSVPTEKRSIWTFVPQPQLVIINLGTNDFSSTADPTEAEFEAAYRGLLSTIRTHYPAAHILCTVGPGAMLGGDFATKARPYIAAAVAMRVADGDTNVEAYELATGNANPGCDSHPSLATHELMAQELSARITAVLGW